MENQTNIVVKKPKKRINRKTREALYGYAFASLWIIGFLAFVLTPLITSLFYSFTNFNTLAAPKFTGLTNYITLYTKDTKFWPSLGNTLYHVLVGVPFSIITGLLVALVLNKPIKGQGIWRTIFYLPNIVSFIAMSLLWIMMFDKERGMVNSFLGVFGFGKINWLGSKSMVKNSLILMGSWGAGVVALFFIGALKSIPRELYEAAEIAGVKKVRQFFTITLPLITPTIQFMLITSIIAQFQVFTIAYTMTGGGPDGASYYLGYYLFDKGILEKQLGYASAMSWTLFILVLAVIYIIFKTSKKWVYHLGSSN